MVDADHQRMADVGLERGIAIGLWSDAPLSFRAPSLGWTCARQFNDGVHFRVRHDVPALRDCALRTQHHRDQFARVGLSPLSRENGRGIRKCFRFAYENKTAATALP